MNRPGLSVLPSCGRFRQRKEMFLIRLQRTNRKLIPSCLHTKYAKGKELDADETALIAKIAPEAGWHYSWGHKAFNEKRYWDALLYLENAFYLLREKWYDQTLSDEGADVFFHCCYLIGFCYDEMKLYQKAYYYLSLVWPLDNITYN